MTVFLVGGAVRDLTSGAPIRDLDVAVQGNATKLKKELQKAGGVLIGEDELTQTLYFTFTGGVRLEVGSTLSATYPKPGKPVYKAAPILDDLHRRDFTANAMALSLNDGSFGLLMDPLNGVADIENRELRLVSNYGFIEDPARMIRATRLAARLGWQMEEKTRQRYDNAKAEGTISALHPTLHKYELEEIFHEEDPLRVLKRLEAEGWAKVLFPAWTSSKANETELDKLRDVVGRLESMGIFPDPSAAYFPLLIAKLAPKDVTSLKKHFARPGFAEQIPALEADTKTFAALFTSKAAAAPSDAWKMLYAARPEAVLSLAHTAVNSNKNASLKARFEAFFNDWSQARTKIPYQLMQEMRITPALPVYDELVEKLFYAVMDAKLETPEAARAFLEPYSPPAPPPPVNMRRKAVKREAKVAKPRAKKVAAAVSETLDVAASGEAGARPTATVAAKAAAVVKKAAPETKKPVAAATKATPVKAAAKPAAKPAVTKAVAKKPAVKVAAKKAAKPVAKKVVKAVAKKVLKPAAKKAVVKAAAKKASKASKAATPAKKKPVVKAKPAAKKTSKPAVKAKPKAAKPKAKAKR